MMLYESLKRWMFSCALFWFVLVATVGADQYVDANTWIAGVEKGRWIEFTHKYDRRLLREYFLHFRGRNPDADIYWKLLGLAAFGDCDKKVEVERLAEQWLKVNSSVIAERRRNEPAFLEFREMVKLVIPARCGDGAAMKRLLSNTGSTAVKMLMLCHNQMAMDRLAEIANDDKWPAMQRLSAIDDLVQDGDQRGLDVLLSDKIVQIIKDSEVDLVFPDLWQNMMEIKLPQEVDSPAKMRAWLKEHPDVLVKPKEKISVRGGIDWSKVDFTKSPPEYKP